MQELISKKQEESLAIVTFKLTDKDNNGLSLPLKVKNSINSFSVVS